MSINAFTGASGVKLTSTTSNQTVTVPAGFSSFLMYNGAADTVYVAWAVTVAVMNGTWNGASVTVLPPGTTQVISGPIGGGTLAYIATTTGGELVINGGEGS